MYGISCVNTSFMRVASSILWGTVDDNRLCWVQETLREQRAVLEWVSGLENVADIFTKSTIQRISYGKHLGMLGIVERRAPTEVFEVDAGEWDDERICAVLGKVVDWSVLEELESRLGNVNPSLVYWLVIEFCTSAESNMGKAACEVRGVKVIRITLRRRTVLRMRPLPS